MNYQQSNNHESRADLIADYALDAFEELMVETFENWDTLGDDQRWIVYQAVMFGARAACTVLGETTTHDEEYEALLVKLRASM